MNPKGPTKHQLKSEATRKALLKAAETIFARDGFERAQIDEIASLSGRTRGAVYSNFKTKEQLFFALQEQRIAAAGDRLTSALEKCPDSPAARLAALRDLYSDLRDADTAVLDVELKMYAMRNPDSREDWQEHYVRIFGLDLPRFTEVFGIADSKGSSSIRNRLLSLTALKSGIVLTMRFLPNQISQKEAKLMLCEIFDGLFPPEP